jgi:hypothetical protein
MIQWLPLINSMLGTLDPKLFSDEMILPPDIGPTLAYRVMTHYSYQLIASSYRDWPVLEYWILDLNNQSILIHPKCLDRLHRPSMRNRNPPGSEFESILFIIENYLYMFN